jgi:hypothetical protein
MSDENKNFEEALAEWRRKHGIQDNDAVLQMLELLKLFFQNVKIEIPPDTDSIQLVTIRVSLQSLAQLTKDFSKEARELTQEIRNVPQTRGQTSNGWIVAFLCIMVTSLAVGIFIGRALH